MMRRAIGIVTLVLLVLLASGPLSAQGAPEQIEVALLFLSEGVGRDVTLNDLSHWRWSQDLYPDVSLGCPQPDTAYSQVVTQGYRFLFTFNGVVYDYRISADESIAFLCSRTSEAELAEATPTPVSGDTIDQAVGCSNPEPGVVYLPQRLTANIQAQVVSGPPIIQRGEPGDSGTVVGEIPGDSVVEIVAGPVCTDGQVWWQVAYQGQGGWTVEGRDDTYWMSMRAAAPLPPGLEELDDQTLSAVAEVSHSEANIVGKMALSPDGDTLAILGGPGTNGVWLYDIDALDTLPGLLRGTTQLTAIAYSPSGETVVLGDNNGGVRIWATDPQAAVLERWFDMAYENSTTAVAFSSNGSHVATAGDTAITNFEGDGNNAILIWDIESVSQIQALFGHEGTVNALAFSPDGTMLASASGDEESGDTTVRLWNLEDGSVIDILEEHLAPVQALAFSPDGSLLASLDSAGVAILWEMNEREFFTPLVSGGLVGRSLAFSPDGDLLAVGGGNTNDSGIRIWDVDDAQEVSILSGHEDTVGALAFNADGTLLISASADKSLRFWGVSSAG